MRKKVKNLAGGRILEVGQVLEMGEMYGHKHWWVPRDLSQYCPGLVTAAPAKKTLCPTSLLGGEVRTQ